MWVRGRHSQAFTLVELLVVIAIIVVLIAILLAVVSSVRSAANFVQCQSRIRCQLMAHRAYAHDHRDWKPPLLQRRAQSVHVDWVSPDIKWNDQPVGQGILVKLNLLRLEHLLDSSEDMQEDVQRDRVGWESLLNSGSSYVYFWHRPPDSANSIEEAIAGATYKRYALQHRTALVMDINAEPGHPYLGEYQGRVWIAHRRKGLMNVGYTDGSVKSYPIKELMLRYPGGPFEELDWFEEAHRKYGQ